jgi:hypothetical protein
MLREKCSIAHFPFHIDEIRDVEIDNGSSMMHEDSLLGDKRILGFTMERRIPSASGSSSSTVPDCK